MKGGIKANLLHVFTYQNIRRSHGHNPRALKTRLYFFSILIMRILTRLSCARLCSANRTYLADNARLHSLSILRKKVGVRSSPQPTLLNSLMPSYFFAQCLLVCFLAIYCRERLLVLGEKSFDLQSD